MSIDITQGGNESGAAAPQVTNWVRGDFETRNCDLELKRCPLEQRVTIEVIHRISQVENDTCLECQIIQRKSSMSLRLKGEVSVRR